MAIKSPRRRPLRERASRPWAPNSKYAAVFERAAKGDMPLEDALETPDLRIGRTDPKLDPKGAYTITGVKMWLGDEQEQHLLGPEENPAQIFPEENLLARVDTGQVDVGFFYRTEAMSANIRSSRFPEQCRAHRSHYLYAGDHEGRAASANRQNLRRFHSHRRRSRYLDARGYNLSEVKAQFPKEQAADGNFKRQEDAFRDWVTADGSSGYPAQAGRYHLYVSLACPWACRTVIVRALKGLEAAIGMTVVDPIRDERGWRFTAQPDTLNGWTFLSEAYTATDPDYDARVTVPVLWDKERGRIVSNSDDDIMRMFETQFDAVATNPQLDLYPNDLRMQIDELNDFLYETFNNGVYRAGFATSQAAYEWARLWSLHDDRCDGGALGIPALSAGTRPSNPIGVSS